MSDDVNGDIESLRAELEKLRADLAAIAGTLRDMARHGSGDAMGKAQDTVEQKPLSAALVSFGIGVLIGFLVSGRRG
jgi:ElaB/YqjD/DUF883 family membrane-anchored ribosome-binding protein